MLTVISALQREYGQDRAWLTLALEADLQSVFHWNTKQVPCPAGPCNPIALYTTYH